MPQEYNHTAAITAFPLESVLVDSCNFCLVGSMSRHDREIQARCSDGDHSWVVSMHEILRQYSPKTNIGKVLMKIESIVNLKEPNTLTADTNLDELSELERIKLFVKARTIAAPRPGEGYGRE